LILPTNTPVRFLITSEDVIHSWSVPELGIKVDAIPGRINQIIVEIKRPGVFYGMCSELCGSQHGFMPIVIQAVPIYDYIDWILKLYNFIFDNENTNVINL
jgi:heme/copper-type cytochrome/quinol oxidase subunit 2